MSIERDASVAREVAEAVKQEALRALSVFKSQRRNTIEVRKTLAYIRNDIEQAEMDIEDSEDSLARKEREVRHYEEGTEWWIRAEDSRAEEEQKLLAFKRVLREKRKELKVEIIELKREMAKRRQRYREYRQKKILAVRKESEASVLERQAAHEALLMVEEQEENQHQVAPNQEGQAAQEDFSLAEEVENKDQVVPNQSLEVQDQAAQMESA